MFSYEFFEIFKNTFFTEHLRATVSGIRLGVSVKVHGIKKSLGFE